MGTCKAVTRAKAVLLLVVFMSGCTPVLPLTDIQRSGTYLHKSDKRLNGFKRTSLVHVPPGYDPDNELPLVVVLHGAFSTAEITEEQTGFSRLADRENFIVLYPNGIGLFGFLQHWNAGHCCGKAAKDDIDDVQFVESVIRDIRRVLSVDPARIYMAGMSNGGMLTHYFAAKNPQILSAAAVVAGAMGGRPSPDVDVWQIPEPKMPVPMLIIHSRADTHVPYRGGRASANDGAREYLSVDRAVSFWATHNHCSQASAQEIQAQGVVTRKVWSDCPNRAHVVLYSLKNWPHQWPGPTMEEQLENAPALHGFDATETIWEFFKTRQQKPGPP